MHEVAKEENSLGLAICDVVVSSLNRARWKRKKIKTRFRREFGSGLRFARLKPGLYNGRGGNVTG